MLFDSHSSQKQTAPSMIEALEERRLLSTSSSLGAIVTIDGSRRDDDIVIHRTADGHYDVVDNGVHLTYRVSRVKRMVINGRTGDDLVSVDNSNGGVIAVREIHGGSGNDTVSGGKGEDDIFGDIGDDRLDGRQGNDDVNGGDGNDTCDGDLGDDSVAGDAGDDDCDGGDGHDHVDGGVGHDTFHGGHDDANERADDDANDDVNDDHGGHHAGGDDNGTDDVGDDRGGMRELLM